MGSTPESLKLVLLPLRSDVSVTASNIKSPPIPSQVLESQSISVGAVVRYIEESTSNEPCFT